MKNKNEVVIIREEGFLIFFKPFSYASGIYYGNGRQPSKKKNRKIPDRRQKRKDGEIRAGLEWVGLERT